MKTVFTARSGGQLTGEGLAFQCVVGAGGVIGADRKTEGDGCSPLGIWPMRRLFFRPDRIAPPATGLERVPIAPHDGWCDAPGDPLYNRQVSLPYPASHETLWREDGVYDLIIELGYNDAPVQAGRGSAIFLHVARPDFAPTEGCVALARTDLLEVLRFCSRESVLEIAL